MKRPPLMARLAQRLGLTRYDADLHYARALQAHQQGDFESAHAQMRLAIRRLPNHAEYHAAQGFFFLEDDSQSEAVEAFARALSLNPYEMMANYGRGIIAWRGKDWEAAAAAFLNALAAQPARPEVQYYLALVKHRQGDNGAAWQWMQAAQAGFAKAKDKRERRCRAWMREFAKLLEDENLHKAAE